MEDKYVREQFVGKTRTDKLKEEISNYFIERKFSKLGFLPRPGVIGVVSVLEDNEIMDLGGSAPYDQINNNFGKWVQPICSPITNSVNNPVHEIGSLADRPVPISGTANGSSYLYNGQTNCWTCTGGGSGASQIMLGQGTTAPLIDDIDIETPLADAPENARTTIQAPGVYDGAGKVDFFRLFGPTGGSGTINEMGWFVRLRFGLGGGGPNPNPSTFMFSHDEINPGVNYVSLQTILAEYFITI
jgi:hypothetical protein